VSATAPAAAAQALVPDASAAIQTQALRKVYPLPKPPKSPGGGAGRMAALQPPMSAPLPVLPPGAKEIVALDALDLAIPNGAFFGLLGPNGAGKTTTIGILTTRVLPSGGRATVAGRDVVRESVAVKQRIGVVPQRANPDHSLSVRENLVFHATYFGVPRGVATAHAQLLLERFGMGEKANSKVSELSGGQQQRLMIARALMHEPDVLFLDEPTVGLDPQARLDLWDILRGLHAQGRTIVLTTHYMEEADRLCEQVAIIDRGRLLALDAPGNLKARAPGGTLVQVTLDGPAEGVVAAAADLPGLLRVEAHGPVVHAYAERTGEVIAGLLRLAEQSGRTVKDIHLTPPSLETLFVAMTGRGLA